METHTSRDRSAGRPIGHVVEKLRSVSTTLFTREDPSGLSVESRVANRKGRRR